MSDPEALPVGHATISYAIGGNGHPSAGFEVIGVDLDLLSPEWDDSEEEDQ